MLLALLLFLPFTCSYKILVISPAYGVSHMNFMGKIADTLTDAGHNVTYYINDVNPAVGDRIGVKTTKNVIRVEWGLLQIKNAVGKWSSKMWETDYGAVNIYNMLNELKAMTGGFDTLLDGFFHDMSVVNKLKEEKFDVALGETVCAYPLALMEYLDIPARFIVQTEVLRDSTAWSIGEKIDYTTVPSIYGVSSDKMNLMERIDSASRAYLHSSEHTDTYESEVPAYRKHLGADMPHWKELFSKASFVLYNSIPFLDFPRQTLPKTVQIGGLTVNVDSWKAEKLDEEFTKILSLRSRTVLVSFGSAARSADMPIEFKFFHPEDDVSEPIKTFRLNILKVMKSLPDVTFLWKFEDDDISFADGAQNVHIFKWIPQVAVLTHPNLTLFVTHGGIGSIHEIAYLGVPAITIPLTFDQPRNARMLERHGGSIFFNKKNLGNYEALRGVLTKALGDDNYSKNAKKLANVLDNVPYKPKETLVKYVEFAAKVGNLKTLDPESKNLSWFTTFYLDAISLFFITSSLIVFLIWKVVKFVYKRIAKSKRE